MISLILAIFFWLAGMCVMGGGYVLARSLRSAGRHLLEEADYEKGRDNSLSIALGIEGKILSYIPSYLLHMIVCTAGLVLIAVGFVSLAFFRQ